MLTPVTKVLARTLDMPTSESLAVPQLRESSTFLDLRSPWITLLSAANSARDRLLMSLNMHGDEGMRCHDLHANFWESSMVMPVASLTTKCISEPCMTRELGQAAPETSVVWIPSIFDIKIDICCRMMMTVLSGWSLTTLSRIKALLTMQVEDSSNNIHGQDLSILIPIVVRSHWARESRPEISTFHQLQDLHTNSLEKLDARNSNIFWVGSWADFEFMRKTEGASNWPPLGR